MVHIIMKAYPLDPALDLDTGYGSPRPSKGIWCPRQTLHTSFVKQCVAISGSSNGLSLLLCIRSLEHLQEVGCRMLGGVLVNGLRTQSLRGAHVGAGKRTTDSVPQRCTLTKPFNQMMPEWWMHTSFLGVI